MFSKNNKIYALIFFLPFWNFDFTQVGRSWPSKMIETFVFFWNVDYYYYYHTSWTIVTVQNDWNFCGFWNVDYYYYYYYHTSVSIMTVQNGPILGFCAFARTGGTQAPNGPFPSIFEILPLVCRRRTSRLHFPISVAAIGLRPSSAASSSSSSWWRPPKVASSYYYSSSSSSDGFLTR